MESIGIASVGAITVIAYLVGSIVKISQLDSKWIPSICGVVGGVLGVWAMFVMPDFPANNVIESLAVGIISGLAATGFNEAVVQLSIKSDK